MVPDRMRCGVLSGKVRVTEPILIGKQLRQGVSNPNELIESSEGRGDPEGSLEVVDGLLQITFGTVCIAKSAVAVKCGMQLLQQRKIVDCRSTIW